MKGMMHVIEVIFGSLLVFSVLLLLYKSPHTGNISIFEVKDIGRSCLDKLEKTNELRKMNTTEIKEYMKNCVPSIVNVSTSYTPEDKDVVSISRFIYGDESINPRWITVKLWIK